MQTTQKYKLNLIEPSDPFLPEGLNENTRKIEAAMLAHEEGLERRMVVLESFHFAYGTYSGEGNAKFIPLPFKPKAVYVNIAHISNGNTSAFSTDLENGENGYLKLREDGFTVSGNINQTVVPYNYIAFG